jgi:isopentenyl-diphosphate delta-isomerase
MADHVILVDEKDNEVGTMEKVEAHRRGVLHRAFSIFLFSPGGLCLVQRRAEGKYHSGGLWANACCSHPRPGEDLTLATGRRLEEELGVRCELRQLFEVAYDLDVGAGLREAEFNHTFVGTLDKDADLTPDPEEVGETAWRSVAEINAGLKAGTGDYAPWFAFLFPRVCRALGL